MKQHGIRILSFFLTLTSVFSIYVIYDCFSSSLAFGISAITIATTLLFFALCYLTEKHRFIGGIFLGIALFISLSIYSYTSMQGYYTNRSSFLEWVLTKGTESESTIYIWTLYIFFTTFFSVTIYYFANVLYRMFFLTLISLIPPVLYLKVLDEIDNVYLILIALLNISIFLLHRNMSKEKSVNPVFRNTLLSCGFFVFLLFLITAAIPKNDETPYYDVFEDTFLGGDTSSPLGESFAELSTYSGDAGLFLGFGSSNRKLYTITCSTRNARVNYLKRQNFDYYNFKKDRWYADEALASEKIDPSEYEKKMQNINLFTLHSAMQKAEKYKPGFAESHNILPLTELTLPDSKVYTLHISSENFGAAYFLAPTQCLNVIAGDESVYYATPEGAFYIDGSPHDNNYTYRSSLYNDIECRSMWLQHGGCNMTGETYRQLLEDIYDVLKENNDSYGEYIPGFIVAYDEAMAYKDLCEKNNQEISSEIRELALSITENASNEYEKANALADYFHENDFVYDLDFRPLDNSPEHFLFSTKKGSCSDYASAFTLMARSIGLTVRYAEGYVLERGENGFTYVIKSRDSHAYPEVFIPGLGWVNYEPTVDRMESMETHFSIMNFITNLHMDYGLIGVVIAFAIACFALFIAIRFLLPFLSEIVIFVYFTFASKNTLLVKAYNRLVNKATKNGFKEAQSKTPYEFANLIEPIGCDISNIVFPLELLLYSHVAYTGNRKDILSAYRRTAFTLATYKYKRKRKTNQ